MKLGAYTACLHDRPLDAAMNELTRMGLTSLEVNSGGFIPSPHCHVDLLLASQTAREDYLGLIEAAGMELTALNCNGNPLSPSPQVGPKHADDLRRSIELAGKLGVGTVVAMSGLPGTDADAHHPAWVVNCWNGSELDVLDYQWSVAKPFWQQIDALAADTGVVVALELHPQNLVFNPQTFRRFLEVTGASQIGVEMDTSHLMWQGMDVPAVIRDLGDHIVHAAAKDVALGDRGLALKGVLDVDFTRVPAGDPGIVPTGYGTWCAAWPTDPAWRFVAVGTGHDMRGEHGVDYWGQVLGALAEVKPDIAVNIEHEDAAYGRLEGLEISAATLHQAAECAGRS
ncbi:sugar phosphate isomerase/epimerase family protein [Devriesea agamarum]|uniref:sugar phosphate isomerase/epimerase family protein n=1 Tax=Devriesea agamarum TaxID=472569 RepID=UPI00071D4DC5|nr:sugar phosphate isomerase/epimerase [Devriesea agamarum]